MTGGCGSDADRPEHGTECFAITAQVEQWRCIVEKYFKPQHVTWALNIIQCESGGDPNARNASSGASGLFQHMPQYWADRAAKAGFPGASVFDPEANTAASAYLLYAPGGGPSHWSCKYSPYEQPGYQPQCAGGTTPAPEPAPAPATPCATLPATGGIVDDASSCFELHGTPEYWRAVSGEGHAGGFVWTDADQRSAPDNWARWNLAFDAAGTYTVKYYAVDAYALFVATRYVVRHAGQDSTVTVDQSAGGTGWRTLGTFDFAQGGDQHVSVHDDTQSAVADNQHIVADALQLVPGSQPEPVPGPAQPTPAPPGGQDPGAQADPGSPPTAGQDGFIEDSGRSGGTFLGGCAVGPAAAADGLPALFVACAVLLALRRRRR